MHSKAIGFRADSAYISNDWKENRNGEGYLELLQRGRPDIQERAAGIRARVEAVNKRFSKRYGWGDIGEIRSSGRYGAQGVLETGRAGVRGQSQQADAEEVTNPVRLSRKLMILYIR